MQTVVYFQLTASISNTAGPTAIATNPSMPPAGVNGSITLGVVTGGVAPFTYSVDASPFTSTTSYTNLAAGPHSIDVRDANGCVFSTTAYKQYSWSTAIAATIVNAACGTSNGSITLGVVTGGVALIHIQTAVHSLLLLQFPNMAAGTYAVEVMDVNGCVFSTMLQ